MQGQDIQNDIVPGDAIIGSDIEQTKPSPIRRFLGVVSRLSAPLVVGLLAVAAFEIFHRTGIVSQIILPSPFSIIAEWWQQAFTSHLWRNLWVTTQEAWVGFVFAVVAGVGIGVGIGLSRPLSRGLYPYVVLVQSMPRIALVPLFIAIFGFGMETKIVTAAVLAFFPPLINTIVGFQEADENAIQLMRSFVATRWQIFRKLLWPGALPAIFGGLKTALTLSFLGAFVGELTAANEGIGLLMTTAAFDLRMDALLGYLLWFSGVSLVSFGAIALLEAKLVHWKEDVRVDIQGERVWVSEV